MAGAWWQRGSRMRCECGGRHWVNAGVFHVELCWARVHAPTRPTLHPDAHESPTLQIQRCLARVPTCLVFHVHTGVA